MTLGTLGTLGRQKELQKQAEAAEGIMVDRAHFIPKGQRRTTQEVVQEGATTLFSPFSPGNWMEL